MVGTDQLTLKPPVTLQTATADCIPAHSNCSCPSAGMMWRGHKWLRFGPTFLPLVGSRDQAPDSGESRILLGILGH